MQPKTWPDDRLANAVAQSRSFKLFESRSSHGKQLRSQILGQCRILAMVISTSVSIFITIIFSFIFIFHFGLCYHFHLDLRGLA